MYTHSPPILRRRSFILTSNAFKRFPYVYYMHWQNKLSWCLVFYGIVSDANCLYASDEGPIIGSSHTSISTLIYSLIQVIVFKINASYDFFFICFQTLMGDRFFWYSLFIYAANDAFYTTIKWMGNLNDLERLLYLPNYSTIVKSLFFPNISPIKKKLNSKTHGPIIPPTRHALHDGALFTNHRDIPVYNFSCNRYLINKQTKRTGRLQTNYSK